MPYLSYIADLNEAVDELTFIDFKEEMDLVERVFPWLTACLVFERDAFMSLNLAKVLYTAA